jgi:hypothetical protein
MLVFAAAIELFALTEPARGLPPKPEDYFSADFRGALPVSLEISTYRGLSAMRRLGSSGFHGNIAEPYPPFTCVQLQIIDEIELLDEPFDCD